MSSLQEKVEPGSPDANLNVAMRLACVICDLRSDVAGAFTSGAGGAGVTVGVGTGFGLAVTVGVGWGSGLAVTVGVG